MAFARLGLGWIVRGGWKCFGQNLDLKRVLEFQFVAAGRKRFLLVYFYSWFIALGWFDTGYV